VEKNAVARLEVTIADVSDSGIGLLTKHVLPLDAAVTVAWQEIVIWGEVRHCRRVEEGYRVGVQITRQTEASDGNHISEETLALYAANQGDRVPDRIHRQVSTHVQECFYCRVRLMEAFSSARQI
jgi:hypothetical protein